MRHGQRFREQQPETEKRHHQTARHPQRSQRYAEEVEHDVPDEHDGDHDDRRIERRSKGDFAPLRLGATGLTFYDDQVTAFFSPHAAGKGVMFLMACGQRAPRGR